MPLTPLRFREIRRKLLKVGFEQISQRDSHVRFVRRMDGRKRTAIVPRHAKGCAAIPQLPLGIPEHARDVTTGKEVWSG
ncbi:MAG: type II toxin-antitoxin system HicA family toxin [Candidatus Poribacteria bacterium]